MIGLFAATIDKGIEMVRHTVILTKEVKEYNKQKEESIDEINIKEVQIERDSPLGKKFGEVEEA